LIVRERGGPALARNTGAEMARGRYLAFIDDDCVPVPGWLSALVRELDRGPDRLLGGPVINGLPGNPYATATQSITTFAQRYYRSMGGNEPFFTTNNLALSTERFREIGQFETSIRSGTGEDREFCDRWRSYNWPMDYVADAEVVHSHHLTLLSFIRQHYRYGRGILAVRLIRRRRGEKRVVPEPFSFYWDLILFPLREPPQSHVARGIALMIVAQLATIVGFFSAAIFDRPYLHAQRGVAPGAKRSTLINERDGAP
jgi:GT2 family glycosyltransferase